MTSLHYKNLVIGAIKHAIHELTLIALLFRPIKMAIKSHNKINDFPACID